MDTAVEIVPVIHRECGGQGCRTCQHSGEVNIRVTDRNRHLFL